jgi:hypothetical protein
MGVEPPVPGEPPVAGVVASGALLSVDCGPLAGSSGALLSGALPVGADAVDPELAPVSVAGRDELVAGPSASVAADSVQALA